MKLDYKSFKSPPLDFYLCPWWCWNAEMKEEEMIWQLKQFKDHGIPQVFIAPYYGLDFPYLSETFWEKYEFALKEAEKLGMKIWLYDEYCWPSGNAGGFMLRDEPWTRGKAIVVSPFTIASGKEANVSVEGKVLALRAFGKDMVVMDVKDYKVKQDGERSNITWKNTTGKDCTLLVFTTRVTKPRHAFSYGSSWTWDVEGYVDTLNPKAVRRFMEWVHEEYAKRFGKYFGTMIPGIFTDEVHMVSPDRKDAEKWYYPFTEGFLESFEKEKGYSLLPKLHELVLQVGDYVKTRYDYWSFAHKVYSESYYKQIYDWCAAHKIGLTGHPLAEEWLNTFWVAGGDVWHQAKYMQYPGQDRLGLSTGYDDPGKEHPWLRGDPRAIAIGTKTICSSAKFTGAKRILSETFGLIPWSCTLEDKKRVLDFICSMGINLINDNKHQYSIRGFRKRYYSHGMYFSMPYFKQYGLFSEYMARLCLLTASEGEGTEVATLYPSTTAWTVYDIDAAGKPSEDFALAEESLRQATDALMREQWANDFMYEEILEKAEVKKGVIQYKELAYKALIIPSAEVLPKAVLAKVVDFAKQGGILIFLNLLPSTTPEGKVNVRQIVKELTGIDPAEHNAQVLKNWANREKEPNVYNVKRKGNVAVITHIGDPLKGEAELTNLLEEKLQRYIEILSPASTRRNFVSCHRKSAERNFFFLSNINREAVKAEIKLKAKDPVQIWDLTDGSIRFISARSEKNGIHLTYTFPRTGSVLFVAGEQKQEEARELPPEGPAKQRIALGDEWTFSTETPNICRLELRALASDTGKEKESAKKGQDKAGKWIPLVDGIFLPEGLKLLSAGYWWLRAKVNVGVSPEGIMLVVDDKNYDKVYVNGEKMQSTGSANVWDRGNIAYKLDNYLKPGENTIVIGVGFPKWWSERVAPRQGMDPIVLVGSFEVHRENDVQKLSKSELTKKTGSWHEQGYPYYSGTGIYEQTVKLPKFKGRVSLEVQDAKEVVELLINGKSVGAKIWQPFKFEIGGFVKEGENKITIKVTNTLENLFEKPYPSGMIGACELAAY